MRRIIDGKRYDTETAEDVASWHNHYYPNDFHYCTETLYRTKKGGWFLAGEGGPLSKYARSCGDGRRGGKGLFPITEEEARQWLEERDGVDVLEKYFGHLVEDA
jgi:hypothetical protein